jgi:hypothetical protein
LQPEGHRFDPGILHGIHFFDDKPFHPVRLRAENVTRVLLHSGKQVSSQTFFSLKKSFRQFIICHDTRDFRSSYEGHTVDALAREGDEGRGKLR